MRGPFHGLMRLAQDRDDVACPHDSNDVGHIRQFAEAGSQDPSVDSSMRKGVTRASCHGEQASSAESPGRTDADGPSYSSPRLAFSSSGSAGNA